MNDVAAIILAAGRSRRMGAFKPLLLFGEKTVIETVIDNFIDAAVEQIVVVTGHRSDEVRQQLAGRTVSFVLNLNAASQMSESIALGVAGIVPPARAVLITPADHPAVTAAIIERLIQEWRRGGKLIQPEYQGKGGHPVLIDLVYRDELANLEADRGLRGFFEQHRPEVVRLPLDSPFVARDMDTWDDYEQLHEMVFGRKPSKNERPDDSKR